MNVYSYSYNQSGMWEIRPERLKSAMERAGLNQSQLADAVGLKQPSIGRLLSGETKTSRHLVAIATALKTSPEYLIGETDDPSAQSDLREESHRFMAVPAEFGAPPSGIDLVSVHEIDLTLGMGATYMEVPVTRKVRHFDKDFLRKYTDAAPDKLFFCEGIGNSMAPYIESHDLLLVDTSQQTVRLAEQVWAVAYGACGAIKRLFPLADGSVKMRSDNPSVPDEIAYDGELHVIGRVVAIIRRL